MLTRRAFISGSTAALALIPTSRLFAQSPAQLQFNSHAYLFRWTNGKQFEFTPQGEEDLDHWTNMITVIAEPDRGTPDLLAQWANNLSDAYNQKGAVLRTSSVPATPQAPAQHFLVSVATGDGVVECGFNRFLLMQGVAYCFIYSYRIYGADRDATISQMRDWIIKNGAGAETAVMAYAPVPDIGTLQKWQNTH
jgi:hypothetical protein